MDFSLTPEQEAFRAEVRAWFAENVPPEWKNPATRPVSGSPEEEALYRAWARKVAAAGYTRLYWPKEYGGRHAMMELLIFYEEMAYADAPRLVVEMGLQMIGPAIMAFGTEEQKQYFLPKILAGEIIWCQGFSEPNAGSDLASLQTRAELDGDEWVVNGTKIWTSSAHRADWCALLARTDPNVPKHRGISYFLVDMKSPGLTVRPIRSMDDRRDFNQLFFDNVRVPRKNLLGELNRGWYQAQHTLGLERGPNILRQYIPYKRDFMRLLEEAKTRERNGAPVIKDPVFRQRIASAYTDLEIMRLHGYRMLTDVLRGGTTGAYSSVYKLHQTYGNQRVGELGVDLLGLYGLLDQGDKHAVDNGEFVKGFLSARSATIAAGTAQIQRNIVAERLLGMPR